MKVSLSCLRCSSKGIFDEAQVHPLREDGLYTFNCPQGHSYQIRCVNPRHEVLAHVGVQSFRDGYYREAVSSFASCLERFFEFYVLASVKFRNVDRVEFDKSWKSVSAQSERQFGLFIMAYLTDTGKFAPQVHRSQVELRNKVIHKGYIPTRDEATAYCNEIVRVFRECVSELPAEILDAAIDIRMELQTTSHREGAISHHLRCPVDLLNDFGTFEEYISKDIKGGSFMFSGVL